MALAKRAGLGHVAAVARSFRIVCDPEAVPRVEALLEAQGYAFEPEPFSPWCRRLVHEPAPLGSSLAARFGLIYIQDRSSMLPPLALDPPAGAAVLDMCASPGGKTSFLAQLAGRGGYVLGNEPSADRLATLRQNLARLNLPQAVSTGSKGQDLALPPGGFSYILLDPPCSGWGTADKNPQVLTLWKPDKVEPLTSLQRELLAKAASLLAPGGRLLYSTCTTNRAENEDQAVWAASELGLEPLALAPFAGFSFHDPQDPAAAGTLRVDGEGSEAQGFYLALFTKPDSAPLPDPEPEPEEPATRRRSWRDPRGVAGKGPGSAPGTAPDMLAKARTGAPDLAWGTLPPGSAEMFKDELCFVPARGAGLLPVRRKGQRLGRMAGDGFRPWARARLLLPPAGSGPELDADEPETVTALLEGRSISVQGGSGRMGLYFRGLPLGFLTVKGGRALWSDR
ncbi:MAG: RsmB/NOP family class I SAM-dependent RNA methyltransferase [Acidobacteriota bacterium]